MNRTQLLNQYSLDNHYSICNRYLNSPIWELHSLEAVRRGVTYFDVSDVILLFPHLELDQNYSLICYLISGFHDIWGRIAAIKHGDERKPIFEKKSNLYLDQRYKLPLTAVPPMEAVYHDGTAEGCFEAVLCSLFLSAFPYAHSEQNHWNIIMNEPPSNIEDDWNIIVDIPCWSPHCIDNKIIAFKRKIENGCGSSNGKDRIYLTQFNFQENLGLYHIFTKRNRDSMYKNQIDDDKRYNKTRCCCVFSESSVLVAEEK